MLLEASRRHYIYIYILWLMLHLNVDSKPCISPYTEKTDISIAFCTGSFSQICWFTMASSAFAIVPPNFHSISLCLDRTNYGFWRAQVLQQFVLMVSMIC